MSLWDPEAAGNAANFLRLPDRDMLEIRNQPFDGAKAVWVPYADTGYCKATVLEEGSKPGTTKVLRAADTKEKEIKNELIEKQNPPKERFNKLKTSEEFSHRWIEIGIHIRNHRFYIPGVFNPCAYACPLQVDKFMRF